MKDWEKRNLAQGMMIFVIFLTFVAALMIYRLSTD